MSDSVPTVKIWTANGPVIINESDFDAAIHTLATPDQLAAETPAPAPVAAVVTNETDNNGEPINQAAPAQQLPRGEVAAPATMLVSKKGKKFIVVDDKGTAIVRDGIEPEGYASEADAWAAITAAIVATNA